MNADEALAVHRAMINEVGEDIVVRRYTGSGTPRPKIDITTRARVMGFAPDQLVGAITQGDRRVIALADTLSSLLPLNTNDKVVVRGKEMAIKAVDDNTRRIGGALIAIEMTVGG